MSKALRYWRLAPDSLWRDRVFRSYLSAAATLIEIAGLAVGGVLAATVGPATAISLDAASYLCSAVVLALIPRAFHTAQATAPHSGSPIRNTLGDIREGLVYLWQHRLARTLTLLGLGVSLTGGAVTGILVVYAVRGLGLAQDDPRLGGLNRTFV